MKGSNFKRIILFAIGIFILLIIPANAHAGDYSFAYEAFSCSGTTNNEYKACVSKYYKGEYLPRIEDGDTVNPGDTIMVVLTYNHTIEDPDYAATNLNIFETFDTDFVKVATYRQLGKDMPVAYAAKENANPVFGVDDNLGVDWSEQLEYWTASATALDGIVSLGYKYSGNLAGLMYFPGALGFTFFKVLDDAPSGQTFTFGFDTYETAQGNGTNYNAPIAPTTASYIYNSDVTPISFKVAGDSVSNDTTLSRFDVTGSDGTNNYTYSLTPTFTPGGSAHEFDLVVPAKLTNLTLDVATTDSTAQIIKTATTTSPLGSDKTVYVTTEGLSAKGNYIYQFTVHAEDGTEVTYQLNVYKLNDVATLSSLSLTNSNINFSFVSTTYSYTSNVLYGVKSTNVNAGLTDPNAIIVSGTGAWGLNNYGSTANVRTVLVEAEDCKTQYQSVPGNSCHSENYTLTVNRGNPSTSVELSDLRTSSRIVNRVTVPAGTVDGFTSGTTVREFDLGIVDYETSQLTFSATPKADANGVSPTITAGLGTKNLSVGANSFSITVKAEDNHTENYVIKVYRKSNDTKLGSLEITSTPSGSLDPAFTDGSFVGPYTYNYPSGVTQVTISATVNDTGKATINGDLGLYSNLNTPAQIIVTSENGDTKTFTIRFEKILETDNLLSSLTATNATLSPETFDPETNTYTATVDGNISSTTIDATLHSNKAKFVDGFGPREVELDYGENTIYVRVQSEYGQTNGGGINSYNIVITRNKKSIKVLDSVTVTAEVDGVEQQFNATYNSLTQTYSIDPLPYSTTEATITAVVPQDSLATYTVFNQENGATTDGKINLKTGANNAKIRVKAHDDSTAEYTVSIPRSKNNVSTIEGLEVFGEPATCNGTSCTITVANEHSSIAPSNVVVTTTDENATVTKPTNTYQLYTDRTTTYLFTVTAEDGITSTEYELVITRKKSTDNTLANVEVTTNEGEHFTCTSFIDYKCTISVPSTTISYTLDATATSTSSDVDGTGSFTMGGAEGSLQKRIITVTSEDNISQTYEITIERSKSTNANLSSITIDGNVIDGFDGVNKQVYNVTVPGTTATINLNATVADTGKATIENESTVLGRKDLEYGSNVYTIKVIAEAGGTSVKTYTVTVTRSNNIDSNISMIKIGGIDLEGFDTDTKLYEYDSAYYQAMASSNQLVVPYTQTAVSIVAIPRDSEHGSVLYNNDTNSTINLTTGANTIVVTGVAHDGSKTNYTLKIFRELNTSNSVAKLEVAGVTAIWNEETEKYTVTVPNDVTSVSSSNIVVTLPSKQLETDPDATVTLPNMDLVTTTTNNYQFVVTSESGVSKTYDVAITRTKSDVNTLKALTVTNGSFNPSFVSTTNEYTVTLPSSAIDFTVNYVKDDPTETVTGAKKYDLTSSSMDVNVVVKSESGIDNTYVLHIVRTESAVNTLSTIMVSSDGVFYPLAPEFSPDVTIYEVEVPGTVSTVNIGASVTDTRATITDDSDIGEKSVVLGNNQFKISVRAEANATKDYYVNVKVLPKSINTLDSITARLEDGTKLTLSPEFDKDEINYRLSNLAYSQTRVILDATKTDSDSEIISGTGANSLTTGENTLKIVVRAQDNTEKTYNIRVYREKNNDATLSQLNVSGTSISPSFDPERLEYTASVDSTVTSIKPSDITAWPTDSVASVNKQGELTLTDEGPNRYNIVVTAEDGTQLTYSILFTRRKSSDAYLKRVDLSNASISPAFTSTGNLYTLTIPSTATEFTITGVANDDKARVEGNNTYSKDTTQVVLTVIAEDNTTTKEYTFNVITADSMDATLATLSVTGYDLNQEFIKTTVAYGLKDEISYGTTNLNVQATATNPNATINYYVNGVKQDSNIVTLPQSIAPGSITVEVVPANNIISQARSYTITYNMVTSKNNYLATLIPSISSLNQTFSKGVVNYSMSVPFDTETISFQVTTEDISASVANDGSNFSFTSAEPATYSYNLRVGTQTATFTVKAANGDLRDYQVAITRTNKVPSSEVHLSSLSVDDYALTPGFDRDVETYSIGQIPFSLDTLVVRAQGIYAGQSIKYLLNGAEVPATDSASAAIDVSRTSGNNLIVVQVTAENMNDVKNYQISYSKIPSTNTFLQSMVDSTGKINNFSKTTPEYNITVGANVNSLTLTLATEDEHSRISIGNNSRVHQWAYQVTDLKGGINKVTIIVTAENGDTRTYVLTITKEGSSELITSRVFGHTIEDGMIKSARLDETLAQLKDELDNDNNKLQLWDATEDHEITDLSTPMATGMILKLIDLETGQELDRKIIVVRGDTSGDAEIDLFDAVKILRHDLGYELLTGPYLTAGDVDHDGEVDLFDAVKILRHDLGYELLY